MGNCHNSELNFRDISSKLDELVEINLLLLKAIHLYYVTEDNFPVCFKLEKILSHIKEYFEANQLARAEIVANESAYNYRDISQIERNLNKEELQLKEAKRVLSKVFRILRGSYFNQSVNKIRQFIDYVETNFKSSIEQTEYVNFAELRSARSVDDIAVKINDGKELNQTDQQVIKQICTATTYVFNDSQLRTSYPRKPNKPTKYTEPRTSRKNKIISYATDADYSSSSNQQELLCSRSSSRYQQSPPTFKKRFKKKSFLLKPE